MGGVGPVARAAEAAGIKRWSSGPMRGFGGATNFNHRSFETLTWAAGLAASDRADRDFLHRTRADGASCARGQRNRDRRSHLARTLRVEIVAGWNEPEIRMFGVSQREHDQRYAYADEFTTLLKRLWTENGFDFSGEFFKVPGAYWKPKPVQRPWPLIMSAGNSPPDAISPRAMPI